MILTLFDLAGFPRFRADLSIQRVNLYICALIGILLNLESIDSNLNILVNFNNNEIRARPKLVIFLYNK